VVDALTVTSNVNNKSGSSGSNVNGKLSLVISSETSRKSRHKHLQVPSLPERDAAKFFLLSHMLDYLCGTMSFDLHGKVHLKSNHH
jgi:hypothetical protein